MSRNIKSLMIDSIQKAVSGAKDLFVVDVSRVNALSVNRIRLDLAGRGIRLLFVKNAVASRALLDLGLDNVSQAFIGASALAFGVDDVITISRELMKCTELYNSFAVRSGIVDGRLLSSSDVNALSKSPGKSELLSQLSACILAPSRGVSQALSSYRIIVGQIACLSEQQ